MTLRHFIDLLFVQTSASIRAEAKKTYIGYLWWLLDPLMFIGVYYVVFGLVLQSKTDNFIVFLIIGILAYQWFQASIMQGIATIHNAGGLIKRIRLPKVLFILTKLFHNLWQFMFVFIVYSIVIAFFGIRPSLHFIAIPIILIVQLVCIFGITAPLAGLYPFFPDIKHVVQPVLRAFLFVSGIFFPASKVPENLEFYFYLNPMANLIEAYRDVMLRHVWPDWMALLKIFIIFSILIGIGLCIIQKNDSNYAKRIP